MSANMRSPFGLRLFTRAVLVILISTCLISWRQPTQSQAGAASPTATVYPRRGLIPAVVYVSSSDQHIHELAFKNTWQDTDLTAASGAPLINGNAIPMAFRMSDGVSMVVYWGADRHVYAIYLELLLQANNWHEVWHLADLTAIAASPLAATNPYGFNRSDGVPAVVYMSSDGHVHELRLDAGWHWSDLTVLSNAPVPLYYFLREPVAYVRSDGMTTVLFECVVDHICELRLDNGWKWADLTADAGAPITGSPYSLYIQSDGLTTINYIGSDHHLYHLKLGLVWQWADLTALSGAPLGPIGYGRNGPFGYVRYDGINTVVFATEDLHLYEIRFDNGWKNWEMTSIQDAVLGWDPKGYVRADGFTAVVYQGNDNSIREIRLESDGWHPANLTYLAGAPSSWYGLGGPWPYNRSTLYTVNLAHITW